MTNTTKEGAGEIPEAIKELEAEAWKQYPNDDDYNKIDRDRFMDGGKWLYHHLTTSSPSKEELREQFYKLLKLFEDDSKYTRLGLWLDVLELFASQFPQPQLVSGVAKKLLDLAQAELRAMYKRLGIKGSNILELIDKELSSTVSGVRTKEEILDTHLGVYSANPLKIGYVKEAVLRAMEEYKNQFHSTRPIQNNKLLVVSFEEFPNVEWVASLGNLPGMCESGKTKMEAFAELTISLMMKLAYDSNIHDKNDLVEMAGHIKAKLLNKEPNAQERDASKADQGTARGEHHPTQEKKRVRDISELKGEKVYRWVKASERLPEFGKRLELELDEEGHDGFLSRDGHGDCYFTISTINIKFYEKDWDRIEWREEIPLSTHTSEGREAIGRLKYFSDTKRMAKDCWLFLTNDSLPENAEIKKKAFLHEVESMIICGIENQKKISEGKREAIEFMEWAGKNGYRVISLVHGTLKWAKNNNLIEETSEQLYNIYLEGKGREDLGAGK